jgi:hypothetical protein
MRGLSMKKTKRRTWMFAFRVVVVVGADGLEPPTYAL